MIIFYRELYFEEGNKLKKIHWYLLNNVLKAIFFLRIFPQIFFSPPLPTVSTPCPSLLGSSWPSFPPAKVLSSVSGKLLKAHCRFQDKDLITLFITPTNFACSDRSSLCNGAPLTRGLQGSHFTRSIDSFYDYLIVILETFWGYLFSLFYVFSLFSLFSLIISVFSFSSLLFLVSPFCLFCLCSLPFSTFPLFFSFFSLLSCSSLFSFSLSRKSFSFDFVYSLWVFSIQKYLLKLRGLNVLLYKNTILHFKYLAPLENVPPRTMFVFSLFCFLFFYSFFINYFFFLPPFPPSQNGLSSPWVWQH